MTIQKRYLHARSGTYIPVPGGKQIKEMIGRVHSGTEEISLAHMIAPPGWGEPPQTPEFAELTVVLRGRVQVEIDGEPVVVAKGEAIWTPAGVQVHFGNPFDEDAEYYAICVPAFSPELTNRDPE